MNFRAAAVASFYLAMISSSAAEISQSQNKTGAVLIKANKKYVHGNIADVDLKIGREAGHVGFDETLSGRAITVKCVILLTTHGRDTDDGWAVKATNRTGKRLCSGVENGVYINF